MKTWSCFCVAAGFLFFSQLDVVNLMKETDYCKLKNCPAEKKPPHIACKNKGNWSPQCGLNATIISIPKKTKKFIINYHNTYRDLVAGGQFHRLPHAGRMLKLSWSSDLARLAELLVKRCDLHPTDRCISTELFSEPGYHAVYNKFKKNEDTFRIVRSQLNSWYDEYKHVSAVSLLDGLSSDKKEIGHFMTMMVGPSNRLGCAMARVEKGGWTHQWLACVYSCSPKKNSTLYEFSTKPGILCTTGVDAKYQHLCKRTEPVDNCKHSPKFNGTVPNNTASLIRAMMKKPVQPRTFWYWWKWLFGWTYTITYPTQTYETEAPTVDSDEYEYICECEEGTCEDE
ncbi:antigen 5 like allergen Cul n 1-like [Drosophila elegans]|uniref:antigen 5 like allergen Cul n 1-like n=1 Tax=Drosophila elegans TaxID=30023 RepID=UPI0007E5E3DB|nr:antigen 5 like allergen Cul n 1-like [Drosophila elegans]